MKDYASSHSYKNPGLDALRTVAILLVILMHGTQDIAGVPESFKQLFSGGWAGVDIFFVLSGYLIGSQVKSPIMGFQELLVFWFKRWTRTMPLYYLVLAFYVGIKPILFHAPFQDAPLGYFFFSQNISAPRDFVQSWSLCIEEQFYFFFPLLIFFIGSYFHRIRTYVLILLASVTYRIYLNYIMPIGAEPDFSYRIIFPTLTHLDGISMGILLSLLRGWKERKLSYLLLPGTAVFALTLICGGGKPQGLMATFTFSLLAIGAGLMLIGSYHLSVSGWLLKGTRFLASISYGLYLLNNPILKMVTRFMPTYHWVAQFTLFFISSCLLSWVTYQTVELPVLRWRERLLLKKKTQGSSRLST